MISYIGNIKELLKNYEKVGEYPNGSPVERAFNFSVYWCKKDDVFSFEKFVAIQKVYNTILTAETLEALTNKIERRCKVLERYK